MKKYDKWIFIVTVLLLGLGTLMIYSSTSVITQILAKKKITEFYYFKRHIITILIGFVILFLAYYKVKLPHLKKIAVPLLVFSLVLLALVFVPGIGFRAGGATRWIRLGMITFQPSELVKLSMVIFLATYMSKPDFRTDSFKCFIIPICTMVAFQAVFLKQPDFGAAMSLAFLTFAMLFLSEIRLRYLASLAVLAVPVVVALAMKPYRWKRITCFLDPWKEPEGCGYQLIQSFIAFGSGGFTGVGIGSSKQKLAFLPESHTDFIFSIIGEEFGFFGILIVVALFAILFVRGISIANKVKDRFVYYLAIGLSLMISLQALINFAVVTGMIPTKGLPLPFISYGGSCLLINMAAIGLLLNISRGEEPVPTVDNREVLARRKAKRNVYKKYGQPQGLPGISKNPGCMDRGETF